MSRYWSCRSEAGPLNWILKQMTDLLLRLELDAGALDLPILKSIDKSL